MEVKRLNKKDILLQVWSPFVLLTFKNKENRINAQFWMVQYFTLKPIKVTNSSYLRTSLGQQNWTARMRYTTNK